MALAVAVSGFSGTWRAKLPEIGSAWIGSFAGLAIELASPGKSIRGAVIAKAVHVSRPSWLTLPFFTFGEMLHFLQVLLQAHWRELVAMMLLGALIGMRSGTLHKAVGKSGLITLGFACLCAVCVLGAAMAPAALYYGALPPLWDQIIAVYVCACATAALGWWSGQSFRALVDVLWHRLDWPERLRRRSSTAASVVACVVVGIGPIATLIAIHQHLPAIQAYAATKDAQASGVEAARATGKNSATVPPLAMLSNLGIFSHTAFEDLMSDPHYWINVDEARYYGIRSMATPG